MVEILVTGGAGFIGSNLCRHLVAAGHGVTVIDDLSTGAEVNLDGVPVRLVVGSITDPATVGDAAAGVDVVVHLAARGSVPRSIAEPVATHDVNTTGTLYVLEAARAVGAQVIVASSSSVYGANPELPKHEGLVPRPVSPYAATKLATETYALAWGHSYGMDVLAFRFFNVFGPRQPAGHVYAAVIPKFVAAALAGEPVTIHGAGTQSRDFTFVDSVCAAITDAIARRVTSPTPVNLAFGNRITLLEALDQLEAITGRPVARDHVDPRAGDVPHSQADTTRLCELFPGIAPVPFADGLRATVDWMRTQV
jgi:UDP-glucose 4-epimerase